MATRRRVLSRAVALALGGSLVGVGAAVPEQSSSRGPRITGGSDPTILSVAGEPSALGTTGVPGVAVPHLETVREFRSASVADVDRVAGTVRISGSRVSTGSGTAWGSFDARAVANELEAEPDFSRVDRPEKTTADGGSTKGVFLRSDPALGLSVASARIDLAHGDGREDTRDRLRTRRQQSAATLAEERGTTGLPSILGGDIASYVSPGERTRARIVAELPDSASELEQIVRDVWTAGVAIEVGPETTTTRYALSLREDHQADEAVTEVKQDVTSHEATRLLDEYATETTIVVDVLTRTDLIWAVQKDTIGAT